MTEPSLAQTVSASAVVDEFFGPGTVDIPKMDDEPGVEEITLPAGLLVRNEEGEEELVTSAYVRELTGEDEEALAKAADNPSRYFSILLERGVTTIGENKPGKHDFAKMLTGDRSTLILAIRRATYGDEFDTQAWCPNCEEWVEVSLNLKEDVPIVPLEDPKTRLFEVELRKGRVAEVVLVDGNIEEKVLASTKLDGAQRNTLILSLVVRSIDKQGVMGRTAPVQKLGIADRQTIIEFVGNKTFGPDYNSITFEHDVCGKEVPVVINAGDLFRF